MRFSALNNFGHLKLLDITFESGSTVSYSHSIATVAVSSAVSEIFSVK